jgi:hypothetical protein
VKQFQQPAGNKPKTAIFDYLPKFEKIRPGFHSIWDFLRMTDHTVWDKKAPVI